MWFFSPHYIQKIPPKPFRLTLKDKFTRQIGLNQTFNICTLSPSLLCAREHSRSYQAVWCWCDCCLDHDHLSIYLLITPYPTPRLLLLHNSETVPNFGKIMVVILRWKRSRVALWGSDWFGAPHCHPPTSIPNIEWKTIFHLWLHPSRLCCNFRWWGGPDLWWSNDKHKNRACIWCIASEGFF